MISDKKLKELGIEIMEDGTHLRKYRRYRYLQTELPYLSGNINWDDNLINSIFTAGRMSVQEEIKQALAIFTPQKDWAD